MWVFQNLQQKRISNVKWQSYNTLKYKGFYEKYMGFSPNMAAKWHNFCKLWIGLLYQINNLLWNKKWHQNRISFTSSLSYVLNVFMISCLLKIAWNFLFTAAYISISSAELWTEFKSCKTINRPVTLSWPVFRRIAILLDRLS